VPSRASAVTWFRWGLVFKAHILLNHSTLGRALLLEFARFALLRPEPSLRCHLQLRDTKVYEPWIRARLGTAAHLCSSQFNNNYFTEMYSGSETGSYLRRIDSCITQLKAEGPSRTCNESKEEEEEGNLLTATLGRVTSTYKLGNLTTYGACGANVSLVLDVLSTNRWS